MIRDPIAEEIRAVRRRLWDECGGDFEKYLARLGEDVQIEPSRVLTLEQRRKQRHVASSADRSEH
ncbi:MAG: hypothetical protein ACODAJ_06790 [Planctomycetota bacterium]